jgi:hypothetical protein
MRAEDPVLGSKKNIKVQGVLPGANGQTPNVVVTAHAKATYASVVKRVGQKVSTSALKKEVKVTD